MYKINKIFEFYDLFLSKKPNSYTNPEILNNEELKEHMFKFLNYKKPKLKKQEYTILKERVETYYNLYQIITLSENTLKELKIPNTFKFYLTEYLKYRINDELNDKKSKIQIIKIIEKEAKQNKWNEEEVNLMIKNVNEIIDKYLKYIDKKEIEF